MEELNVQEPQGEPAGFKAKKRSSKKGWAAVPVVPESKLSWVRDLATKRQCSSELLPSMCFEESVTGPASVGSEEVEVVGWEEEKTGKEGAPWGMWA